MECIALRSVVGTQYALGTLKRLLILTSEVTLKIPTTRSKFSGVTDSFVLFGQVLHKVL